MARLSGFENERQICQALNNKRLINITQPHLREFILDIFDNNINSSDLIFCEEVLPQQIIIDGKPKSINIKQDLMITVNGIRKNISVKMGSNNSVHEEHISTFISFIESLGATQEIINSLLKFQWADGTLNNSGPTEQRLKGQEVTRKYNNEMRIVHNFFNVNRLPIIMRALSTGAYENSHSHIDYIHHGTIEGGVWCSLDYALTINSDSANEKKPISVGFLTFQNQNRNTTLNRKKEYAREQIQFKWSNMVPILEKSMTTRSRLRVPKLVGSNKHGFENQQMIINALNGEKINQLRPNLKRFIKDVFPSAPLSSVVTCELIERDKELKGKPKGTFDVSVGNKSARVLVKFGKSLSIHQEKYEDFYKFLAEDLEASNEVIKSFKKFQWADGTLDGSNYENRLRNNKEILPVYTDAISEIQNFVTQKNIAKKLLNRFLKTGENLLFKENDYLYIGDSNSAYWASTDDIINYQINNLNVNSRASLNIGNIIIKNWGRSIHKRSGVDQRQDLQAGLSNRIIDDIKAINAINANKQTPNYYTLGEASERDFVKLFNSREEQIQDAFDEKLLLWEGTSIPYAVKVKTKQFSSLTENKENTKSDAYLIKTNTKINEQLLYERDFYLDENDIESLDYESVSESGVSIKRADSKSFTYAKFRRSSFEKLFNDRSELFVGALLYTRNRKDFVKNEKILSDNQFTLDELKHYYTLSNPLDELAVYKDIKTQANKKIKEIIENDQKIYEAIFFGIEIFHDPYCATYLYTDALENKDNLRMLPFSVTTGSGRSKGQYTIIIKP